MKEKKIKERETLLSMPTVVFQLNESQLKETTIETALPLLYKTQDGLYEEMNYLDLSRRQDVCGILTGMIVWPLVGQRFNILYFGIQDYVESNDGAVDELCLPTVADFENLNEDDINATFHVLRSYGLECEDFVKHGVYWTRDRDGYSVAAYSFANRSMYYVNPNRRTGHLRGCVSKCRLCKNGKLKK